FSTADPAKADTSLLVIESEITGKKELPKIIDAGVKKIDWWRVAAMVLLVVLGAGFLYSLLNSRNKPSIAEKPMLVKNREIAIVSDSIGPAEKTLKTDIFQRKDVAINKRVSPPFQSNPSVTQQKSEDYAPLAEKDQFEDRARTSLAAASLEMTRSSNSLNKLASQPQFELKGKVLDKAGEPLPFASIHVKDSDIGTIADAKGNFTLKTYDTITQVIVNSPGYLVAMVEVKTSSAVNTIILQEESASLSDVVVKTMQAQSEKRNTANPQAVGKAEPEGGWKKFNEYIRQQIDSLQLPPEKINNIAEIILEFSLDEQGRPTDIKAIETPDKKVIEQAVQILLSGPKWKNPGKEKRLKVIMPL
ncbi:MAG TPA: carboxypeptidase-like regulatory domain-containing protein, partial [Segetibacter sp.]